MNRAPAENVREKVFRPGHVDPLLRMRTASHWNTRALFFHAKWQFLAKFLSRPSGLRVLVGEDLAALVRRYLKHHAFPYLTNHLEASSMAP
jgi:hypothetical protein